MFKTQGLDITGKSIQFSDSNPLRLTLKRRPAVANSCIGLSVALPDSDSDSDYVDDSDSDSDYVDDYVDESDSDDDEMSAGLDFERRLRGRTIRSEKTLPSTWLDILDTQTYYQQMLREQLSGEITNLEIRQFCKIIITAYYLLNTTQRVNENLKLEIIKRLEHFEERYKGEIVPLTTILAKIYNNLISDEYTLDVDWTLINWIRTQFPELSGNCQTTKIIQD